MSHKLRFAGREVVERAANIAHAYHDSILEVPVIVYFSNEAKKFHGREALGYARKLTPHERHLLAVRLQEGMYVPNAGTGLVETEDGFSRLEDGFAIVLWEEQWRELSTEHKDALLDHELCHCWVEAVESEDGSTRLVCKIKGHDIEEFYDVIERHGDWMGEVKRLNDARVKHVMQSGQELLDLFPNGKPEEVVAQ